MKIDAKGAPEFAIMMKEKEMGKKFNQEQKQSDDPISEAIASLEKVLEVLKQLQDEKSGENPEDAFVRQMEENQ